VSVIENSIEIYKNMAKARTQDCINYQQEIEQLKQENERLKTIINNIHAYIEKMSYCEIVDNPKKELSRILEKGE
jgi:cell division protein FtsB